jgi:hypothetical protein
MERTLARKAAVARERLLAATATDDDEEPEPELVAAPDDDSQESPAEPTPSPVKVAVPAVQELQMPVDTISPLALLKPGFYTDASGVVIPDEDDEGYRSSHSSPGVPLAQVLAGRSKKGHVPQKVCLHIVASLTLNPNCSFSVSSWLV